MVFFNKVVMNGASLFGVCLTLTALGFLNIFSQATRIYLFIGAGLYGIGSMLAFIFPRMTTEINTGGLKKFVYSKDNNPQLSFEEKMEISDAYDRVDKRKAKEKATKWTTIFAILTIILTIAGYLKDSFYYYASIIVGVCAFYWIWKGVKR